MKSGTVASLTALLLWWSVLPSASATESSDLSLDESIALADELAGSVDTWAGSAAPEVVDVVAHDGQAVVLTQGDTQDVEAAIPNEVADNVEVVKGGIEYADSPAVDEAGWSGGSWINSSTLSCTAGFSYLANEAGLSVGSTARHCGAGPWYNGGRLVGSVGRAGTADDDVELLSSAADDFVGDVWTYSRQGPVLRPVARAGANIVGMPMQHYGQTSGGGTGVITRVAEGGKVYTSDTAVRRGDSGGPVYAMLPDGRVEALGTVSALLYMDDNKNDAYDGTDTVVGMVHIDIGTSMADLGATVATASALPEAVMSSTSNRVYVVVDGVKRWAPTWADLINRFGGVAPVINRVSPEVLDAWPTGPDVLPSGRLVQVSGKPEIYLIDTYDRMIYVDHVDVLDAFGTWSIQQVSTAALSGYQLGRRPLQPLIACPDKRAGVGGARRPINLSKAWPVPATVLGSAACATLSAGGPEIPGPLFVTSRETSNVYLVTGGVKRHIATWDVLLRLRGSGGAPIFWLTNSVLQSIPTGAQIT